MNVVPIPTTLISGPYRFRGWRGTIRQGGLTVWRCVCDRPHRTKDAADACSISELRARLGRQGMRIWTATYRPKQQFTQAEIDRMDEARELVLLEAKISLPTSQADLASIPEKIKAATAEVVRLEAAILDAKTSDDIRHNQRTIELIKVVVQEHREARQRCESAFLTGEWVIGGWLRAEEDYEATGTRGIIQPGMDGAGGNSELPPADQPATLKEKVGSKMYAWRLKQLADLSLDIMRSYAARLHAAYKEATLTGIVLMSSVDIVDVPEVLCIHLLRVLRHELGPTDVIAKEQ